LRPAISQQAVSQILGPFRAGIHRTLESITDERALQTLVYRLYPAQHPSYAQIFHGCLEDGKDVVVLLQESDGLVLYMY
jgi:hypothetical protein